MQLQNSFNPFCIGMMGNHKQLWKKSVLKQFCFNPFCIGMMGNHK